ncbi:MAG: 3-oxoacyl-[acyl-carrier-protein] reductase [Deltaproteobacteria bacterium]|jgi:3-oxoacyl-[acyl-carrier protein] reductase|nr:3-oxoacyl-[acyl-carrier-protein] reductase [Deltaproteobacteria bacterium]
MTADLTVDQALISAAQTDSKNGSPNNSQSVSQSDSKEPKAPASKKFSRVVLITGGSRGIGRAIALKLATKETAVVVTHVNPESPGLESLRAEISPLSAAFESMAFSTGDPTLAAEAVAKVVSNYGRLDVLVNNAGLTRDGLAVRMSDQDFSEVINVNLTGAFNLIRAAARIMMKQRYGRIINISSVVAFTGNPGQVNYSASKAGLIALTKSLALELATRNVTVNAVAPGFIETDMTSRLDEKVRDNLLSRVPLGRVGSPQDVAEAVAFLASEGASYITGQTIHVNGGLYM